MFDFKLTPAYCLFNGAAIFEQHGSEIIFLLENLDDVVLQGRLKRLLKIIWIRSGLWMIALGN